MNLSLKKISDPILTANFDRKWSKNGQFTILTHFCFFFLQTSQSFCLGVATFASIAVIGALAYAIYHVQSARKKRNSTLPRFDFAVNEFRDSEEQEIWPQTAACKFFQWN